MFELIAAFLFAIGFGFISLFGTSLYSHKAFDLKSTSFYNFQGIDTISYLSPILTIAISLGIIALFHWLFGQNITLYAIAVIGIGFIATYKIWFRMIAQKFEKTKYYRLEQFRQKN